MNTKQEADTVEHTSVDTVESIGEKVYGQDADDAQAFAVESEGITWTPQEERRVVWKIDAVILSLVRSSTLLWLL